MRQHRAVSRRQDESIPVRPGGIRRMVREDAGPEDIGHGRRPPWAAPDGRTWPSGPHPAASMRIVLMQS